MNEQQSGATAGGEAHDVPREEWSSWTADATERLKGRILVLSFEDPALGEVRLAEGQPFVAIDHDELGSAVAFTIRYGDGVVPIRYVIAEPRAVRQVVDASGAVVRLTIEDSTRRLTSVGLE